MSEQHFNALPPGYQIQEYTVKSVLGHGGFGITYLALDNNLGKDVAIKEYLPTEFAVRRDDSIVQPRSTADNDDYEWGLDRFMKEAQTVGLFRHPNIVPVYRAFKANGTAYMVMEYQRGESLSELFRRHRGEFTEDDLLNLVLPLLDGLAVVHKAGFLHRDLKPGNVFIREDGSPVLLDFGAARNAVGRKSKNLTSIVTPGYAPLEQYFADGNQGPWTDIYAIASILYQAVAGRIPPEAPARVKRDPITPAVEAGRGRFSQQFLEAIDTALRVEEEQRPQNVEQWRAMLQGQEVPAVLPPAPVHQAAPARGSATMIAGRDQPGRDQLSRDHRGREQHSRDLGAPTQGNSPSMRFPTVGRDAALAHKARGRRTGVLLGSILGAVVLLAAGGIGAFYAVDPSLGGVLGASTNDPNRRNGDISTTGADPQRDAEARRKAEAEAEARRKTEADAEARRKAEADAEARRKADAEAKRRAEIDAETKRRAEADARRKAEEEARKRADEEARRRGDEDLRRKLEEEAKRAEEARRVEEARRLEEDRRRQEEARRADEEARRREDEARRGDEARRQEEARREEESRREARRREEDERRKAEEEARRREVRGTSCKLSLPSLSAGYGSELDCYFVDRLFLLTMTTGQDNAESRWSNPRTQVTGTIKILATVRAADGTHCRRFQQTVTGNGRTLSAQGLACYRNNAWQIAS